MYPESADISYKMGSHPSSEENIFVPIRAAFDLETTDEMPPFASCPETCEKKFYIFLGKHLRCDMDKGEK